MIEKIPKISVLLICYKQENVIRRAIDSLVAQMDYLYEVCINDDASPDHTWDIILEYKEKFPSLIKPVRNKSNLGIFQNIEATWERPTGDLIYQLSGDDECPVGYFKHVVDFVLNNDINFKSEAICIYGDYIQRNKDGAEIRYPNNLVNSKNAIKLKTRKLLYGRSACYSKKLLDKFEKVSEGKSFSVELTQDCQLQLFSDKNYYIPYVGNIYYAQIGVSVEMTKTDYESSIFEGYDKFVEFVSIHGKPLDSKDLAFIEYMKAYRTRNVIKALIFYVLSIDFSLGLAGLQLNRIGFVLKNNIFKNLVMVKKRQ